METPLSTDAPSAVETLTRQRALLQDWLAKLGSVGGDVPRHVTDRVRRDYEDRLHAVTQELLGHRDALTAELDDRRTELEDADARRAAAVDDLEEARLRHLIGELEPDAWETRRPELEAAVADAQSRADGIRAEVERLDALLRDVAGPGEEEPAAAEPEAAAPQAEAESAADAGAEAPPPLPYRDTSDDTIPEFTPSAAFAAADAGADDDLGVDLSWLEEVEQVAGAAADLPPAAAAPAGPGEDDTRDDDLAFLEELDRVISTAPQPAPAPAPAGPEADRTLDPDRAGMLLCKECGAINEPQLWYCEICGSEL